MQLNDPKTYLDDILHAKGSTFQEHLTLMDEILIRLDKAGMQVNAEKCSFYALEIEFVGYLLTQMGYKPLTKCIEAILKMTPLKNLKEVCAFNGTINFIKNHIPGQAKIHEPISRLTKKKIKFEWDVEQQKAFKKIKAKVAESTMLAYPNLNKPFVIYTNASDDAMRGIMTQDGQGISCFLKKFTKEQMKYPITKQELLTITETLKYHHTLFMVEKLL